MKKQKIQMRRKMLVRGFTFLCLGGACLVSGLAVSSAGAAPEKAADKKLDGLTSIKGKCTFNGKESDWSAKLTTKAVGTYDAVYVSSWGGSPLDYTGTITIDAKEISGNGTASGGRANGTFSFSGKYGTNGVAQCSYKEIGGRRSGSMTAEMPK
ncbi:MAG: hypothetical protein ACOYOU_01775 [Kiritimatiellia bacterium]